MSSTYIVLNAYENHDRALYTLRPQSPTTVERPSIGPNPNAALDRFVAVTVTYASACIHRASLRKALYDNVLWFNGMKSFFDKNSFFSLCYALIVKNTGLLFGLQVVQRIFGLATTYVVVRILSPAAFGEYHFVLSVIGVAAIFGLPGINNAVMQSVARGHLGTYRASVRPAFLTSFVGSLTLAVFGGYYQFAGSSDLSLGFFAAAALFPLAHGLTQWKGLKTGQEDFVGVVKLNGAAAIATSLLLIGTVLFVTDAFAVLVVIILVVQTTLNVSTTVASFRQVRRDESVEDGSIRYGLITTAYMVFGHVAMYIDKLLIFAFLTPASLAVFVAAERLPELVKALIKNIGVVLAPRFARHRHYTRRVDRAFTAFSIVAGIAIVAFAFTLLPWMLVLIFGDDYRESVPYAQVLMCSIAIVSSVPLRGRWVKSQQDAAGFRDLNAIMAIIRIVASSALIPFFGLKGAVISAVLARIGYVITVYVVMKKRYPAKEDDE